MKGSKALAAGYSSVMFDGSHYSIEENVEKTKEIVALAKKLDATVEAKSVPSAVKKTVLPDVGK